MEKSHASLFVSDEEVNDFFDIISQNAPNDNLSSCSESLFFLKKEEIVGPTQPSENVNKPVSQLASPTLLKNVSSDCRVYTMNSNEVPEVSLSLKQISEQFPCDNNFNLPPEVQSFLEPQAHNDFINELSVKNTNKPPEASYQSFQSGSSSPPSLSDSSIKMSSFGVNSSNFHDLGFSISGKNLTTKERNLPHSTDNSNKSALTPSPVDFQGVDSSLLPCGPFLQPHWHYFDRALNSFVPFSVSDSNKLEHIYLSHQRGAVVAVEGERYDVAIDDRLMQSVYWQEADSMVLRGTWFTYINGHVQPYSEVVAASLELAFSEALLNDNWPKRVDLEGGQYVMIHSEKVMVHHWPGGGYTAGVLAPSTTCIVMRGYDRRHSLLGEVVEPSHLFLVVAGIGAEMGFHKTQCVNALRHTLHQLQVQPETDGRFPRMEILPIHWGSHFKQLDRIRETAGISTPPGIEKLRTFMADAVVDQTFMLSSHFQSVKEAIAAELNRVHLLFSTRHPNFKGEVSVIGHGIGAIALFEILLTQQLPALSPEPALRDTSLLPSLGDEITYRTTSLASTDNNLLEVKRLFLKRASHKGTKPLKSHLKTASMDSFRSTVFNDKAVFSKHPCHLDFYPHSLVCLGSPLGWYLRASGHELSPAFYLPACRHVYNVFHPLDPFACRLEPLIQPEYINVPPVQIPHHKGRKRLHLELKDFGSSLIASLWYNALSQDIIESEPTLEEGEEKTAPSNFDHFSSEMNAQCRIDFVLQESPIEITRCGSIFGRACLSWMTSLAKLDCRLDGLWSTLPEMASYLDGSVCHARWDSGIWLSISTTV
ncbi:SEC23-interacting protein-like isoform X2 [Zophobas morio]|uniref:SEC23-interacting protein-like isoform X2 n=1 Tax=Zophobas morio TaxID=2755281 RepID=UPI00308313D5